MFGISGTELVIVAVFVFIIFGPDKIPEIARTVGKAMATFKRVQEDTERLIKAEMWSSDPARPGSTVDGQGADGATHAETQAAAATVASTLYAANDDDDEEEEE